MKPIAVSGLVPSHIISTASGSTPSEIDDKIMLKGSVIKSIRHNDDLYVETDRGIFYWKAVGD